MKMSEKPKRHYNQDMYMLLKHDESIFDWIGGVLPRLEKKIGNIPSNLKFYLEKNNFLRKKLHDLNILIEGEEEAEKRKRNSLDPDQSFLTYVKLSILRNLSKRFHIEILHYIDNSFENYEWGERFIKKYNNRGANSKVLELLPMGETDGTFDWLLDRYCDPQQWDCRINLYEDFYEFFNYFYNRLNLVENVSKEGPPPSILRYSIDSKSFTKSLELVRDIDWDWLKELENKKEENE